MYPWTFCICGHFVEGRFVEEDVLYRRTFCIGGRIVEGCLVEGRFLEGRFVGRTFCSEGSFVLKPKITHVGVHGSTPCLWLLAIVSPGNCYFCIQRRRHVILPSAGSACCFLRTYRCTYHRKAAKVCVYLHKFGTLVQKLPEDMISWLLLILPPFY